MQYTLPKPVVSNDVERALESVSQQLERQKSIGIAANVREYIVNRKDYVEKHEGKYALISTKGIHVTDITNINDINLGFNSKSDGLMIKIGHELKRLTEHAMYCKIYKTPTREYTMPVSFGNRQDAEKLWVKNMEALVDTGCSTTVFDESVVGWIRGSGYNYLTFPVTLDVVGGHANVQTGNLDIDLLGVPFTSFQVNFANLNGRVALIGTDLLNNGKLDIDSGVKMSFTRH